MPDFNTFAEKLGFPFNNLNLLIEALTHRSYLNEHRDYAGSHNERLEFLGDAVLELATTDFLFKKFPAKPEGELTAYRAALVNTVSLAESAQLLGISDYLLLSRGEAKDTGRARDVILADAFEAIIGAIYLDSGYASAEAFIAKNLYNKIDDVIAKRSYQDAKSRFQEVAQEKRGITPNYETLSEVGPDHDKRFTVAVFIGASEIARGTGQSKQEAEQSAAQAGLDKTSW
ncbi:ribonuclease III [Candidatus Kaiserbacteria bacterium RIFCSPLOWO2_02_FULL_54_13]|uniref:Ribonuclease 3 n=1 Tax=Candidatus Kaiserbacteria bacterium RIFCSPHIGHO2_02_FULL_54_22 TaxID=1798495 RepID=A0A1F6DKZ4_9BACT|nr:MAG: ribonuclease III [Candidatus Kaiserbacteria bacterium RIFCSPHIGHO2_02_FULL_54_22]OGG68973.1 MAG: ribonuclease III [Candidatus Kaiserbacteria bacterium RIFCSPHIGHO2_12_FULL_54_16]OGG82494.1 MAG: ribonuclease III [Candidatus Kaiserbacteria bacterium RIFCSPLOWO2_02_FULL_54_13]OGG90383.1 MAG: ribonuclease III [Candidatus Kaiserbacteria bacterium RIFCSPLOWO2_12_FULL_54_10]